MSGWVRAALVTGRDGGGEKPDVRRRRRPLRLLAAAVTAGLMLASLSVVEPAAHASAAAAEPDCATADTTGTGFFDKCDYFATYYTDSSTKVTTDAGTTSVTPTTIKSGVDTTVTQTATVLMKPFFNSFGPVGIGTVGISVYGKVLGYSAGATVTKFSAVGTSFTWSGGPETASPTDCPPDPLAACGSTPTSELKLNQTFSVTYVNNTIGSGQQIYGATFGGTVGQGFAQTAPVNLVSGPTAAFSVNPNGKVPGQYQFVSDSTDSAGGGLTDAWDFGDGTSGTGGAITHNYTKPGTFKVTLTSTDVSGGSDSIEHDVVVAAPTLTTSLAFVDASGAPLAAVSPKIGDVVHYKVTLGASAAGVGALSHVTFAGDPLTLTVGAGLVTVAGPTPAVPADITLQPGDTQSFVYDLTVKAAGLVRATTSATGRDAAGAAVTSDVNQLSFGVSGLTVDLTLSPSSYTDDEGDSGPTPVDVSVTEKITNTTDAPITTLNLRSITPTRTKSGQPLRVSFKSGPEPDPISGYPLDSVTIQPGASYTVPGPTVFSVADDGKIQFSALVTAASPAGTTLTGTGSAILTINPKYSLEFRSRVVLGSGSGSTLPAGSSIVIEGSVRNLTDTATLDVGPLFAEVAGNAGLQGLAYDDVGVDPKALVNPQALELQPGDVKQFRLKILTSYSDPAQQGGVHRSGGTSADVKFTPWADVIQDDGTQTVTLPDYSDVLTSDADLNHHVNIDDSIYIPQTDPFAVAGGIMYGGVQGLWDGASGMVTGLIGLPGVAASVLHSVINSQNAIWDSFTQAQREQFANNVTGALLPVLEANYTRAKQGTANLYAQANAFTLNYFTQLENASRTGNYASTVQTYSSLSANALAQFAIPVVLGKLATSGEAVDAVAAAQDELQTKLAALQPEIEASTTMDQVAATLTDVASGSELDYKDIASLFGISDDEAQALQQLAAKFKFALTVRSRAASSIDWLDTFQAMVKPEALKIKSVSALDIKLGYPPKTDGSLIFKEPQPLIDWKAGKGELSTLVQDFVESKGFAPGSPEYYDAIGRVADRIGEWNKWADTYMAWNKRRYIEAPFNWGGNKMADPTFGGTGKDIGFHLKPTGNPNEYVVQLFNDKAHRFVPVTGDIDPIAFTHLDGSPLSPQEHAELINEMRTNPHLQTQHGESATYVNGGIEFIESQSKPGEALLQITPDGKMRAVRFNANLSVWNSATDYSLVWEGAEIYSGAADVTNASLFVDYNTLQAGEVVAPAGAWVTLPGDSTNGVNFGRCSITFSTRSGVEAALISPTGNTVQVNPDGKTTSPSPLGDQCLSEGPDISVQIQPSSAVQGIISAGQTEVPISGTSGSATPGPNGFIIGQTVSIGAGTPQAEVGTISGFGSIIFAQPLKYAHPSGTTIVVLSTPAQAQPDGSPSPSPTIVTTATVSPAASAIDAESLTRPQASPSATTLADTGLAGGSLVGIAALLLLTGAALIESGRRRTSS